MKVKTYKSFVITALLMCAMCTGCESHTNNKNAAKARWEVASASIKLPMAQQQYDAGQYQKAAKTAAECIKVSPEMPEAYLVFGKVLLTMGQTRDAYEQFARVVELNENLSEGWYWLAITEQQNKNYTTAIGHALKAMEIKPLNVDYIICASDLHVLCGQALAGQELLMQKMTLLPGEERLKIALAELSTKHNDLPTAISLYKEALALNPASTDISEALGYCYITAGNWSEAAEMFERLNANCTNQRCSTYMELLALCKMNAGQYDSAMKYYSRMSVEKRDDARFWLDMGQAALGAGNTKKAYICSQRSLAIENDLAEAFSLAGSAQYINGEYRSAIKNFSQAALLDKDELAFSWLMRSRCYQQLGEAKMAKKSYEMAEKFGANQELLKLLADNRQDR